MEEDAQVIPQGKAYQQYLENTENASSRTTYVQNWKDMLHLILEM